ncbi:MAG TPA: hypothetical protein P5044_00435 [bacterium]|nr:hypothetical protein [bacterium]
MNSFSVRPVRNYKAGYPVKGFFRRSSVKVMNLRLFSFLIIGFLFFIAVPGCFDTTEKLTGDAVEDIDITDTDTEKKDADQLLGLPDAEEYPDESDTDDYDSDITDAEISDPDELGGVPQPECLIDEDCDEGYYCDSDSNTCVIETLEGVDEFEIIIDEEVDEETDADAVPD